jgi:hypothetical protein
MRVPHIAMPALTAMPSTSISNVHPHSFLTTLAPTRAPLLQSPVHYMVVP